MVGRKLFDRSQGQSSEKFNKIKNIYIFILEYIIYYLFCRVSLPYRFLRQKFHK